MTVGCCQGFGFSSSFIIQHSAFSIIPLAATAAAHWVDPGGKRRGGRLRGDAGNSGTIWRLADAALLAAIAAAMVRRTRSPHLRAWSAAGLMTFTLMAAGCCDNGA